MAGTSTKHCYPLLKKAGWDYQLVEQWNHVLVRRKDFAGFADILAWDISGENSGVLAIQSCMGQHRGKHLDKICNGKVSQRLKGWLVAGNHFEVWLWDRRKPRGTKQVKIVRRIVALQCDFPGDALWEVDLDDSVAFIGNA